jgi:hypothetical protein
MFFFLILLVNDDGIPPWELPLGPIDRNCMHQCCDIRIDLVGGGWLTQVRYESFQALYKLVLDPNLFLSKPTVIVTLFSLGCSKPLTGCLGSNALHSYVDPFSHTIIPCDHSLTQSTKPDPKWIQEGLKIKFHGIRWNQCHCVCLVMMIPTI